MRPTQPPSERGFVQRIARLVRPCDCRGSCGCVALRRGGREAALLLSRQYDCDSDSVLL